MIEHLHDTEAVLVVDETGDAKKGTDAAATAALVGDSPADTERWLQRLQRQTG